MVVDTFGLTTGGWPRRTVRLGELLRLAIHGQVRSGVSVKIVDCRAFVPRSLACLMLMIRCRPASRRPDEDDHRAIEEPDGDEAILAVDPRGSRVAGR